MQYVRSISGSVSKTWNSINPATLSGAIDVIVVEREDGSLACSPFHVRFGKFSLLRPFEKKVEFRVNNVKQPYNMKLGEGGEAFFVFETSADVPEALQTSPIISPAGSPQSQPDMTASAISAAPGEPEPLDLDATASPTSPTFRRAALNIPTRPLSMTDAELANLSQSAPEEQLLSPLSSTPPYLQDAFKPASISDLTETAGLEQAAPPSMTRGETEPPLDLSKLSLMRSNSPPPLSKEEAKIRAINLSKKLLNSKIPSHVTDEGDLMLDMTGYKSSEEDALRAEVLARQILSEELEGNYDIGSLIGADDKGHLWIYSSEEAKEAAMRKNAMLAMGPVGIAAPVGMASTDALSDPGYQSDDARSHKSLAHGQAHHDRQESDSAVSLSTPPDSPTAGPLSEPSKTYAKTLRLTSDQLKSLDLKPGPNPVSFTVNRATCTASLYLWKQNVPIVVSDVDGTITKSDALGHVLNMIGRDWTHLGVAKLYSDIVANGYNIMYLTSRSVGQADTTRTYLHGIIQEGYKLPKGPVILSPDRTLAALRREVYLRKPEVFKMACLRDIASLFPLRQSPFYAGFGNRLTDALSYRSVNIPSTRIFTINSNAEVTLDLLSLNKYKTAYTSMRETVDHFFPPVGMLVHEGGEEYTDFNYWREQPLDVDDLPFSDSEDEDDNNEDEEGEYDEGTEAGDEDILSDEMAESYLSRESVEETFSRGIRQSIEQDDSRDPDQSGSDIEGTDNDELEDDLDALDLIAVAAGRNNDFRRNRSSSRGPSNVPSSPRTRPRRSTYTQ